MKVIILLVTLLAAFSAWGSPPTRARGQPFQELQDQIDQLDDSTRAVVQVLAERVADLEAHRAQANKRIAELEAQLAQEKADRNAMDDWLQNASYEERNGRMAADEDILDRVNALQLPSSLLALADYLEVVPGAINGLNGPHVVFEGANVHVRSGSGATSDGGYATGLGNLIIGYNQAREYVTKEVLDSTLGPLANNCTKLVRDPWDFGSNSGPNTRVPGCGVNEAVAQTRRGGSHNLIIGDYHNFNSYGGIVGGIFNAIDENAVGASVLGGTFNLVTHPLAMIVGGVSNQGQAYASAILSGRGNRTVTLGYGHSASPIAPWPVDAWGATEGYSAILTGRSNFVASLEGSIVGGEGNSLKYTNTSVILGGQGNYITTINGQGIGDDVVILGGRHVTATDGAQVQPFEASIEALSAAIRSGSQGCSSGTEQFLEIASTMPGLGDLFGWLHAGCGVW